MSLLGHEGTGPDWPAIIDTIQTFVDATPLAPDSTSRIDAAFCNDVLLTLKRFEDTFGTNIQGVFASLAARLNDMSQRIADLESALPPP